MSVSYDVLGIGNAIVDVIARTEDDFLVRHTMNKGSMALIDEPRAEAIYGSMGPSTQISGATEQLNSPLMIAKVLGDAQVTSPWCRLPFPPRIPRVFFPGPSGS